jgi:hypothetical protein
VWLPALPYLGLYSTEVINQTENWIKLPILLKSCGRGTGNRKFIYESNANIEKGLVEELRLLKYSPRIEDLMAVKFIKWKENLFQYVQNSSKYSSKVAKTLGQAVAEEA